MKQAELDALKLDFLEWTGGFEPVTSENIDIYLNTSMPFQFDNAVAREALQKWMRDAQSFEVPRNIDEQ